MAILFFSSSLRAVTPHVLISPKVSGTFRFYTNSRIESFASQGPEIFN